MARGVDGKEGIRRNDEREHQGRSADRIKSQRRGEDGSGNERGSHSSLGNTSFANRTRPRPDKKRKRKRKNITLFRDTTTFASFHTTLPSQPKPSAPRRNWTGGKERRKRKEGKRPILRIPMAWTTSGAPSLQYGDTAGARRFRRKEKERASNGARALKEDGDYEGA